MVVLVRGNTELARWPLVRSGRPGLALVDELARWQLGARRLGCQIQLRDACVELWQLLELAGLTDVVAPGPGELGKVGREPEEGEQLGVDEGVEPADPVA